MRSLHRRGRETKKYLFLSSSSLCLMGWGSSALEILQGCSWADPGSSQLGTPVAKRYCRDFLEVYRVTNIHHKESPIVAIQFSYPPVLLCLSVLTVTFMRCCSGLDRCLSAVEDYTSSISLAA
jgi:hypothetical protein